MPKPLRTLTVTLQVDTAALDCALADGAILFRREGALIARLLRWRMPWRLACWTSRHWPARWLPADPEKDTPHA